MATFIVRVHGRGPGFGDGGFRGVVSDVTTQESRTFTNVEELLAALTGSEPAPDGRTDRLEHDLDAHSDSTLAERRIGPVEPLTKSQLRVCRLAAIGKSNTDIAAELFVSRATVESHLHAAYRKLGIASRFALPMALIDAVARTAA